jgi:hypothetical protein
METAEQACAAIEALYHVNRGPDIAEGTSSPTVGLVALALSPVGLRPVMTRVWSGASLPGRLPRDVHQQRC